MSPLKHYPVKTLPFTQHLGFRKVLNERVDAYLKEHHLPARDIPAMYLKSAVVMVWWLGSYLLLVFGGFPTLVNALLCVVWAMAISAIGFNIMHDANHGSYSANPRVNKLFSLSAELLGMSGFRWRTKHNVWHHTYTNIAGYDDDVEAYGTLRLSPRDAWKPFHRFQAIYFPVIYAGIALDFLIRDFMMAIIGKSDAAHVYPRMSLTDKIVFWGGKVLYFGMVFVLPLQFFPWWQVIIGFLIVMATIGLFMGVVFQLAHIQGEAAYPVPSGSPLHIENEWAIHQVQTTVDFAPRNWLLNLYIGGLNYQVEHHLLPHVCHMNYPHVAHIVRDTCKEYGIRYNVYATWREALVSHLRQLHELGRAPAKPVASAA